jgi:hypothetical protein
MMPISPQRLQARLALGLEPGGGWLGRPLPNGPNDQGLAIRRLGVVDGPCMNSHAGPCSAAVRHCAIYHRGRKSDARDPARIPQAG